MIRIMEDKKDIEKKASKAAKAAPKKDNKKFEEKIAALEGQVEELEESVRKAGKLINERVKYYSAHYAYKDVQDLLSMTALQFATSVVKMDSELTYRNQNLEHKLHDLNALLSEQA